MRLSSKSRAIPFKEDGSYEQQASVAARRARPAFPWRALSLLVPLLVVFASSLALAFEDVESRAWERKVDPWVLEQVARYDTSEFLVLLEQRADLRQAADLGTKNAKGRYVFETLTRLAETTQPPIIRVLDAAGTPYRRYWIANMLWARGGRELVSELAARSDVDRIVANPRVALDQPTRHQEYRAIALQSVEQSVEHTGAPSEFWSNGFDGQGVVIGGQDTGYDWEHPAIQATYRGWDGRRGDHDYNWHDAIHTGGGRCGADSPEPCDDSRHGTHTMGTMVGDDGSGNRIGLAPGARWIGCRNMDQGVGTPETYTECFQWFLAPTRMDGGAPDPARAPDVINNSWTCPESEGCTTPDALEAVVDNVRAAGILVVASAGNAGPDCSTIDSPIALYGSVLTVGATDNEDEIADFSSRGAITADGSDRRKPDIAAPGVGVRSSVPGDAYERFNGTSMAAPHVAGVAALSLSSASCLQGKPRKLEQHLLVTALPRPAPTTCDDDAFGAVPNNTYGHGALRAVLPACRGDGRIALESAGIATSSLVCRNRSSRSRVSLRLDGIPAGNCMARGLAASAGDRIALKLTGSSRDADRLLGRARGFESAKVICKNRTTGRKVRLSIGRTGEWSCNEDSLEIGTGDRLKIVITGRARADS